MKKKSVENIAFNLLRYAKLFNYHFSWRPTEFGYSEVPINGYTRLSTIRGVVRGSAGCAMAHPDFGRSVNPISTRGDRLCTPNYYWHQNYCELSHI